MTDVTYNAVRKSASINRRGLFTGIAALGAAFALNGCAEEAVPRQAGPVLPPKPASPPALAAAHGFETCSFYDPMNSLDTVDIRATGGPGYNWYRSNFVIGYDTPAEDVTLRDGQIMLSATSRKVVHLWSAGYLGAKARPRYVGTTLAPKGGLFLCDMKFDPALSPGGGHLWPAFWSQSVPLLLAQTDAAAYHGAELDFFEAYPDNHRVAPLFAAHDWDYDSAGKLYYNNQNSNYRSSIAMDANWHTYATLWVPTWMNNGTGLVKRYVDGTHIAEQDVSYTLTGTPNPGFAATNVQPGPTNPRGGFAVVEQDVFCLVLSSGQNWPCAFRDIQAWQ